MRPPLRQTPPWLPHAQEPNPFLPARALRPKAKRPLERGGAFFVAARVLTAADPTGDSLKTSMPLSKPEEISPGSSPPAARQPERESNAGQALSISHFGPCENNALTATALSVHCRKVCLREIGSTEIALHQIGTRKISTLGTAILQIRMTHADPAKVCLTEVRSTKVDLIKVGAGKIRPTEIGRGKIRPGQRGAAKLCPRQLLPSEICPGKVHAALINPSARLASTLRPLEMGAELLGSNLGHEKVQHHEADDAHLQTGLIAGLEIPAQSPCTVTLHSDIKFRPEVRRVVRAANQWRAGDMTEPLGQGHLLVMLEGVGMNVINDGQMLR